jgi:1-phosphofructokinase
VAVVTDLSGQTLEGLEGGLTFLKVSHEELVTAGFCSDDSPDSVLRGMRALCKASVAKNLVVSRADEPAYAILGERIVTVTPPRFRPFDHRGAGDSMTAALAVAQAEGLDGEDALGLAAAAGAMNVTRHGLGTGISDDIREVAKQMTIVNM